MLVPFEKQTPLPGSLPSLTRPVCDEDKADIREAFIECLWSCTIACIFQGTCLFAVKDVFECLDVYSLNHCMKILETVQDTLGDLPHLDNTHQLVTSEIPDLFFVTMGTRIF